MKRRVFALSMVFLALPLLTLALAQGPRGDLWKKVDEAVNKGLPRTAIDALEPIYAAAMKDKNYPEAIKALTKKIALEGNIQGNKPEEKIYRLMAAIPKTPVEMQPVLDTLLANWHWHFFQQNRWRFVRRTTTAESPGEDILAWDLPRVMAEVDKLFARAMLHEKILKNTPIAQYNELIIKGNVPDHYRPTLWDFLAFNALDFFSAGEQAGAKPQDAYELSADSPVFGSTDDFLKWKIEATDTASATVKALKLYQQVLSFHQQDKDQSAFLDADLHRLRFAYNKAIGDGKAARYKNALKEFVAKNGDHETMALALFLHGGVLQQEGELVAAHQLAKQGVQAFPDSVGGKSCFNLIQGIEARGAIINTERVWNAPLPTLDLRYRNLNKVWFRAVKYDYEARIPLVRYRPEQLDQNERNALLAAKADLAWSADLAETKDFHEKLVRLPAPKELKTGFYFVIASHNEGFTGNDNQVTFTPVWVSNLALVLRNHQGDGVLDGFVLDAISGDPIANAEVKGWFMNNNNGQRVAVPAVKTDQNGLFTMPAGNNRNFLFLAKTDKDMLSSAHDQYANQYDSRQRPYTSTVFFTDRALYRPGQTIQFKGLSIDVDANNDNYKVLPNRQLAVIFKDPNGKEISRSKHLTNEYGSFSGSFTAPQGRVTGRMTIHVDGEPNGAAQVSVEEYKRPKFQVTLEKPKTPGKLNATVELEGKAMAYTGAAIDAGKVRYRVVRQVRYPEWWGWHYWWRQPRGDSQEIAHGFAFTGVDGTFKVPFLAKPDPTVPEKDEPTFVYTVHADVTDNAGETRFAQQEVKVGYTALKASVGTADWQTTAKEIPLNITTTTLDGEPQVAEGVLKVYRLKEPAKVQRPQLVNYNRGPVFGFQKPGVEKAPEPDLANPNTWELADVAAESNFKTDAKGKAELKFKLREGLYRAVVETQDRFNKKVTARVPLQVLDPGADKLGLKIANLVAAPKWTLEPGGEFNAVWGSGYEKARAFVEIEHRKKLLQSYWTDADKTQASIKQAVNEGMRGGFTVRVTMVRENRGFLTSHRVEVPWSNKDLTLKWEHFVSKLEPGQKETWTAIVSGPDAKKAVAEMVAGMYDESLDQFLPHQWMKKFNVFRQDYSNLSQQFENVVSGFQHLVGHWPHQHKDTNWVYRHFPQDIAGNFYGYEWFGGRGGYAAPGGPRQFLREEAKNMAGAPAPGMQQDRQNAADGLRRDSNGAPGESEKQAKGEPGNAQGPSTGKVSARKNLNETAFFYPTLVSDQEGVVKIHFTMPEALTKWKFFGFAHDKDLRAGFFEDSAVTARELMVQPNPPRFLREGDLLEFTVKVSNQSDKEQAGNVRLNFNDARTGKSVDASLGLTGADLAFKVPAKESRSFAWKVKVPDDLGFLTYKAVASTGTLADGEEGYLPVLARRVLVTESLPLPIRGPATKKFDFTRLLKSGDSDTLRHKQVTVQVTSNPNWYAVMALPYLMEYPYQCSEQIFNRLYANGLARHIANSDPKIRQVFEQWKNTPALDSPLEKNQDLLAVALEETPWVRQAQNESQARRNVGILFDENRLNFEIGRVARQLAEMQNADGAWPWFPGGPGNDYITLYITTGFGRMRNMKVQNIDMAPAQRSLNRLDGWIDQTYQHILRHGHLDKNNLSPTIALYLYGRSFFLKDQAVAEPHKAAVNYFVGQAKQYWLKLANRQSQAHLACALHRFGEQEAAHGIVASIKERAVTNEEMGMFWRDLELSWFWFRAPIETQAMMIEMFGEVANDQKAVEECKVWLLKQKQTQDWKTTKATADAVYALLLRGDKNPLISDALVTISLGGQPINPEKVEAGTGFYEKRFVNSEVKPEMGNITLKKVDEGVAWGSVTWQYMEDVSKVTSYEGTPLKLKKNLYTRVYTGKGPVLQPVRGPLKVGDELVVRMELRVDRDMEYVHLKDARGSGTEPVNVLSKYRYQDGLAYYESTRDTASHFFIDYLPKGTYVFEYATRVVHKGTYQTGMAQIQCMYAPEYNSHSESYTLNVD